MKYRASIKQMCRHCKPLKRGKYRFIRCPYDKSHNQRQGWPRKVPNSNYSTSPTDLLIEAQRVSNTTWYSGLPNFSKTFWNYLEQSSLNPWRSSGH